MIGRTISRYRIIEELGEGGMGTVYKAEDSKLDRFVAIKALSARLVSDQEAKTRFIREAQAASRLNHPAITTVYDLLDEDDQHYICMEYVEGDTVKDLLQKETLPFTEAVRIIAQAAEALGMAHDHGIIHRDIKSANIMVSSTGQTKLMDFGLAHFEEKSQLTQSRTTMGTIAYSPPEQITGGSTDSRSDIFSLGVVFYELLCNRLPFAGTSEAEVLYSILNTTPVGPSEVREDIPSEIDGIVRRVLAKAPEDRYQSCGELLDDLNAILVAAGEGGIQPVMIRGPLIGQSFIFTRKAVYSATAMLVILASGLFLASLLSGRSPPDGWRIAILPFELLGDEFEQDYYLRESEDALREKFRRTGVLPGPSRQLISTALSQSEEPRALAQLLHVNAILRGWVALTADSLTVSIELSGVKRRKPIWRCIFNRPLPEFNQMMDEIFLDLVGQLGTDLPLASQTSSTLTRRGVGEEREFLFRARKELIESRII